MQLNKLQTSNKGVVSFDCTDEHLLIATKKSILLDGVIAFESLEECSGQLIGNNWYTINTLKKGHTLISHKGERHQLKPGLSPNWKTLDEVALTVMVMYDYTSGSPFGNWAYGWLDIHTGLITELGISYPYPWFTENYRLIFKTSQHLIESYDLNSQKKITFHIENLGRWFNEYDRCWETGSITNIVGIVADILWIDINHGVLLGLNIKTGEQKYVFKLPVLMNEHQADSLTVLPYYAYTHYDVSSNKLIGIGGYSYWEVDLKETKLTLRMWYVGEELKRNNAIFPPITTAGITNTHIFFGTGSMGVNQKPQVAALNRKTLKIDWQYIFESEYAYLSPTKVDVTGAKLYVLDNEKNLHIFERS